MKRPAGRFLFLCKKNMLQKVLDTMSNKAFGQNTPASESLMNTFNRLPVAFNRGEGVFLWDTENKQYIDALGGIAVNILGHSHPEISKTISEQADKLLHVSNLFHIEEQAELGVKFCKISGMDRVFFCNSGAEANEAAIKIARLHGNNNDIDTPTIITTNNSFHGRTMATLSATGNEGLQKGFTPLLSDFIHVAYNDIAEIEQHSNNENVVAVMVEPIQGEAGVIIPDAGYLNELRALCDKNNWLLILDEIQTGMGRTGSWFAYQHEGILPDVMTSAKALGNGIPIGACAAMGAAAEVLTPGTHGSTFGGNPFACAVAHKTIEILEQEELVNNAAEIGSYLLKKLQHTLAINSRVTNIRGKGLMLAVELDHAYEDLAKQFLEAGLVVNITGGGKVIRLLPAAIIDKSDADSITDIIASVLDKLPTK